MQSNFLIKREQSQACLSYAECEKSRLKARILSLLVLLLTAASGAWAADTYTITFSGFGNEACNKTVTDATLEYSETFNIADVYANYTIFGGVRNSNEYVSISYQGNDITITVKSPFEGTVNVTVDYLNENWDECQRNISVTCVKSEPGVEVTTNAASEGATFTEATFQMPAFDATAEYELVRDMSVQMTAQVGDGTQEQPRYRVKKDGNKFIPADMEMAAVPALFTVNDAIEQKALTQTDYIVQIYAVDAEGQPTGQPMTFQTFTFEPGIYAVKAVAADGSDYDGETALSNTFKLFQGYEVEVAAKEFVTYFRDEPLYADPQTSPDAELYTLSKVEGDQIVLSSKADVIPSNVPMLVYNNSDEDKTFLLIPADEEPVSFMWLRFFVGTLEPTTIPASTANLTNYALNGKQFVWVKDAIEVGDHKAWLSIENSTSNARALNIVFEEETTGIGLTPALSKGEGVIYDLSGRKIAAPTKKGIYILNGKKVVK